MPCMCGDTECPSCKTAQQARAPNCGSCIQSYDEVTEDDGFTHKLGRISDVQIVHCRKFGLTKLASDPYCGENEELAKQNNLF